MIDVKPGDRAYLAFAATSSSYGAPRGVVHEVEVIAVPGGSVVARSDTLGVVTAGGRHDTYRAFRTEAEAWNYCAGRLGAEADMLNTAAAECRAKAGLEVVS